MVASIWLRAAHRGVPTFLVTALLLGQSQMALRTTPRRGTAWCAPRSQASSPSWRWKPAC